MDWSRPRGGFVEGLAGLGSHFCRFVTSRHSRDLAIIALVALAFAAFAVVLVGHLVLDNGAATGRDPSASVLSAIEQWLSQNSAALAFIGGALAVVSWGYQAANLRFGVVDIFAAEIATICRVAVVGDLMPILVARYIDGKPLPSIVVPLVVFENVFKDLEVLDSNVVGDVTEFYMYIKEMQNALDEARQEAQSDVQAVSHAPGPPHRHRSLHAIYSAFLAFESGRKAVCALVDDRKLRQEYVLTVLQGELPAFFLLYMEYANAKEDDVRRKRIRARLSKYRALIDALRKSEPESTETGPLAQRVIELWDRSVRGEEIGFSHGFLTPAIDAETRRAHRVQYLWNDEPKPPPNR